MCSWGSRPPSPVCSFGDDVRPRALRGDEVTPAMVAWESPAYTRVCRDISAAKTMNLLARRVDAIVVRVMLAGFLRGEASGEDAVRGVVPIVSIINCKSPFYFDSVHRIGGSKVPSGKRLTIDLADLRQPANTEATCWGHLFGNPRMMRWAPTRFKFADVPTKLQC